MKYIRKSLGKMTFKTNGTNGMCSWPKEVIPNQELFDKALKGHHNPGEYTIYGYFTTKGICKKIEFFPLGN
jgi:hypothetical protein